MHASIRLLARVTLSFSAALAGTVTRAHAQDGYLFTTLAGAPGVRGSADGAARDARFRNPIALCVDQLGTVYIADEGNATIRKIGVAGEVSTLAGTAGVYGRFDATGSNAKFGLSYQTTMDGVAVTRKYGPLGVAVDTSLNVYVADPGNRLIRKVTRAGVVTSAFGQMRFDPDFRYWTWSPGSLSVLDFPTALAIDRNGIIYAADGTDTLRKLHVTPGYYYEKATAAVFDDIGGVAVDAAGNLFLTEMGSSTIRKVAVNGAVTVFAGIMGESGSADGQGAQARFGKLIQEPSKGGVTSATEFVTIIGYGPSGITFDPNGNLLVADTWNHTLRRITPDGVVTTVGGTAGEAGFSDGGGSNARFYRPQGVATDAQGNLYVADAGNHVIRKGTPAFRPRIVTQPISQSANPGQSITLTVAATGTPAPTYQWLKNSAPVAGATNATLLLPALQAADAGSYLVVVTNALAEINSAAATVSVSPPPVINAQPVAQALLGGQALNLTVGVTGTPAPTFQWRRDGEPIAGATNASLTVARAQAGDAGAYTVVVTNAAGSVTSAPASVTVNTSRIVNLSIRSGVSAAAPALTVGFVVSGDGKDLLVRAVGPTLAQFGLTNALADPRVALFAGASGLASNDNWGSAANAAQVATAAAQSGAFALGAGSNDAAVLAAFEGGGYSAQITGPANASGVVLVELYDTASSTAARLVNVSTRAQVGTGDNILVAGFVIAGNAPKTLLIRAIGPTLASFGVTGVLADPRLQVFAAGAAAPIAANDDWAGTAVLRAAFAAQGAFALAAPDSKDAALLLTLEPGSYSAQVSGAGPATGEALIEIYEVP